eukprot:TRINITY_DN8418_c0_g1_i2.p1 TRINITY_DN8418_c0_g1~~TRINITY_DN8418_c0_g1_i2.p1  ORF type:complete len:417 (+),score=113.51 TRINITY_DN8418_c0_g1_i2:378-1628(+)
MKDEDEDEDTKGVSGIQGDSHTLGDPAGSSNAPHNKEKMTEESKESKTTLLRKRKICGLIEGCNSIENYYYLNKIHEGVYGVVFRAQDKVTNEFFAIKRLKFSKEKDGFPIISIREINLLLSLKHANIVNIREVVVGSTLDKIYVVMEYMEHELKDLMEHIKYNFSLSEIKCLVKQLLEGLDYLHQRFIMHRDLKTSNLLYNNKGVLKICDFGLARKFGQTSKPYTLPVVTLWYRSPELLLGSDRYTSAIDIWSVGCIFGELVLKEPLFRGQNETDQVDTIFRNLGTPTDQQWPGWRELRFARSVQWKKYVGNKLGEKFPRQNAQGDVVLSETGLNLLKEMLAYDPAKRITAADALKHAWFKEFPPPQDPDMMPTFPPMNEMAREQRKKLCKEGDKQHMSLHIECKHASQMMLVVI